MQQLFVLFLICINYVNGSFNTEIPTNSGSREYLLLQQQQQQSPKFVRQQSQKSQRRYDENRPNPGIFLLIFAVG